MYLDKWILKELAKGKLDLKISVTPCLCGEHIGSTSLVGRLDDLNGIFRFSFVRWNLGLTQEFPNPDTLT